MNNRSAGFYGQRGDMTFTAMFAVIFVLAVVFTVLAFRSVKAGSPR